MRPESKTRIASAQRRDEVEEGQVIGARLDMTRRTTMAVPCNPSRGGAGRSLRRLLALAIVVLATSAGSAPSALAGPVLHMVAMGAATAVPGDTAFPYMLSIVNVGDATTSGPITLTIRLAPGMTGVQLVGSPPPPLGFPFTLWNCPSVAGETAITCTLGFPLAPVFHSPVITTPVLIVSIDPGASGPLESTFEVSGGDSPPATAGEVTQVTRAPPEFGVDAFDGQVSNAAGEGFTQAGGHPAAASVSIDFNTMTHPNPLIGPLWPIEQPKDVFVDLPPGFVGDPTVTTRCTVEDVANSRAPLCDPSAQVGTAEVRLNGLSSRNVITPIPVYNLVPPPDAPARFGFNVAGTLVTLVVRVRSDDYGISIDASNVPEGLAVAGTTVTFWGVPADSSHDFERACSGQVGPQNGGPSCSTGLPRRALVRNPTSCPDPGHGLVTTVHVDSWVDPGDFRTASFESHLPPAYPQAPDRWGPPTGPTGCAAVPFNPTFRAVPTPGTANTPSGLQVDLGLPQTSDPDVIGQSDLRRVVVRLPFGHSVLSASATGLEACSPAQIGLGSNAEPTCPNGSKLGTVTIETPLLEEPLHGAVYLATPFDNPSRTLLALYIVARGPGIVIKLDGKAETNPVTGEITTTFDNNPQTPFSNLRVEFDGGPGAPLVTPKRCGTYTIVAELTSWSGKTVTLGSDYTVTQDARGKPCPSTFSTSVDAGTTSPIAGKSSPFLLRLFRDDEDQEFRSLTVHLPDGLLGRIALADLCSDRDANAGTCGDGSKLGTVAVGAGAGPRPFYINNGRAYITGPYHGAPFGLSIVVPAIAGPFNLGTVVVRSALFVDKHDATVTIVSDPLPTILEGIPLAVRDIRVRVDRDGFMLNPTSCAEKRIQLTVESTEGAVDRPFSRFQALECRNLALHPRMSLVVGGAGHTARAGSTPLTTTLRPGRGETANLRLVRVTLPSVINARLPVINRACTRTEYEAGNCRQAMAGTAEVVTPLLKKPLRGGVFFVKNGNPLPDLFIALRGQVRFDLIGRVSIPNSIRLRTTFAAVPDVPFTRFTLRLVAGRQGPVGTAANLCSKRGRTAKAELDFVGQNGKVRQIDQRLTVRGCRGKPGKGAGRGRRR
jgi:hypothetical protein